MKIIKKIFFLAFVALVFSGFSHERAIAQAGYKKTSISPTDVFQATEVLRLKLHALGYLDMNEYNAVPLDEGLRHPRHVIQKVRECHTVISKLMEKETIKPTPLPDLFSSREIRPLDVKNGVEHLIHEVEKLGSVSITPDVVEAGKLPVDVYNNLNRICHSVPVEIVPADVFVIAHAVLKNMIHIAKRRDYNPDTSKELKLGVKIPKHVYQETWAFLDSLRELALDPDYAIPGGIIIPTLQPAGEVEPKHVISLMNDALSDTDAIKYSLGVRKKTVLPNREKNKTPTDVHDQIYKAHLIVKELIAVEKAFEMESYK